MQLKAQMSAEEPVTKVELEGRGSLVEPKRCLSMVELKEHRAKVKRTS